MLKLKEIKVFTHPANATVAESFKIILSMTVHILPVSLHWNLAEIFMDDKGHADMCVFVLSSGSDLLYSSHSSTVTKR